MGGPEHLLSIVAKGHKTGGRQKGSRNKSTLAREEAALLVEQDGDPARHRVAEEGQGEDAAEDERLVARPRDVGPQEAEAADLHSPEFARDHLRKDRFDQGCGNLRDSRSED